MCNFHREEIKSYICTIHDNDSDNNNNYDDDDDHDEDNDNNNDNGKRRRIYRETFPDSDWLIMIHVNSIHFSNWLKDNRISKKGQS